MACIIEDNILSPCPGLDRALEDNANSRRKGISLLVLRDIENGEFFATRAFAVLRSGSLGANGCVVNYCPFCGVSIAHHIEAKAEGQEVPRANK